MKYIDLFAGIGGFRYGLQSRRCGPEEANRIRGNRSSRLPHRRGEKDLYEKEQKSTIEKSWGFNCVWSNEWDKYASQIYQKHFGGCDTRDIRTVKANEIPQHDLICAGFPCQSFSIAGKRQGFGDTRGTLFYEICRIARFHRTPYLLLENVKGLLNHDQGQTFSVILESLDELGYDCQWQVLNSKNFGVPQNRERVFIIGHLRGKSRPKVFPIGNNSQKIKEVRLKIGKKNGRNNQGKNGRAAKRRKVFGSLHGFGHGRKALKKGMIRRLTPTECERLQGFPDGWTEGVSDTQRYKCLGNAVTTNVVTRIGKKWNES